MENQSDETIWQTCAACGEPLVCGSANGFDTCWCGELPRILPVPADRQAGCLCPACLEKELEKFQGRFG